MAAAALESDRTDGAQVMRQPTRDELKRSAASRTALRRFDAATDRVARGGRFDFTPIPALVAHQRSLWNRQTRTAGAHESSRAFNAKSASARLPVVSPTTNALAPTSPFNPMVMYERRRAEPRRDPRSSVRELESEYTGRLQPVVCEVPTSLPGAPRNDYTVGFSARRVAWLMIRTLGRRARPRVIEPRFQANPCSIRAWEST
jgi:hypothetical protein